MFGIPAREMVKKITKIQFITTTVALFSLSLIQSECDWLSMNQTEHCGRFIRYLIVNNIKRRKCTTLHKCTIDGGRFSYILIHVFLLLFLLQCIRSMLYEKGENMIEKKNPMSEDFVNAASDDHNENANWTFLHKWFNNISSAFLSFCLYYFNIYSVGRLYVRLKRISGQNKCVRFSLCDIINKVHERIGQNLYAIKYCKRIDFCTLLPYQNYGK